MESPMLKSNSQDKDYHSNVGQKWSEEEEQKLLEELNKNMNIELIAKMHNRTIGGIKARCKEIAYKLHINNMSIEEIILKTKLDEDQIIETIKKRQNNPKKCKSVTEIKTQFSIESEIDEMKNDIKELKNTINELVEMMKAVYEFEDT
jgi:hypothetical protein